MRKPHSESTLRRHLKDMDMCLYKSRGRRWSLDDHLGYMIVDIRKNIPLFGSANYSLTLEEVDAFVYDYDLDDDSKE